MALYATPLYESTEIINERLTKAGRGPTDTVVPKTKEETLATHTYEAGQRLGRYNPQQELLLLTPDEIAAGYDADTFTRLDRDAVGELHNGIVPGTHGRVRKDFDGRGKARLGTIGASASEGFVDAPEKSFTNPDGSDRDATEAERGAFQASIMARDNFAAGTLPGTSDSFSEIRNNPLSEEQFKLYQDTIAGRDSTVDGLPVEGANPFTSLSIQGDKSQVGNFGRGIVNVFNPNNPGDVNERLQDRLLATGNARIKGGSGKRRGTPVLDSLRATNGLSDTDGTVGEVIDVAQSGLAKLGSDLLKAGERLVGKANLDAYDEWASSVEKFFGGDGNVGIVMDKDGNFKSENILGLEGNIYDSRDRAIADEKFGVKKSTREEQARLNSETAVALESGDYGTAAVAILQNLPVMLGDSVAETSLLMIPGVGLSAAIATRVSNQAEKFEKNNNRAPTSQELAEMTVSNLVVLGAEKFLVKSGISSITGKVAPKGRIAGIVGTTVGEGIQETADFVQEEFNTQTIGDKTIGELLDSTEALQSGLSGAAAGGALRGSAEVIGKSAEVVKGLSGSSKVNQAISDLATKGKGVVSKPKSTTPTSLGDADSLTTNEAIVPGEAVSNEEIIATTSEPVANTNDSPTVKAFDDKFNAITETFSANAANIDEGVSAVGEEVVAAKVNAGAAQQIQTLKTLMDAAVEAGATQKQQDLMVTKIQAMVPIYSAKTATELKTRLIDLGNDTSGQVREVLGSSAADISALNKVLAKPDITDIEKRIVEAKIKAIKTYTSVAQEKLIGGGDKPGVFQYLSLIDDKGKLPDNIIDEANAFIAGQSDKERAYEDAKAKFQANEAKSPNGRSKKVVVEYGAGNEVWYDYDKEGKGTTTLGSDGQIERVAKEREALLELQDVIDTISGKKAKEASDDSIEEQATKDSFEAAEASRVKAEAKEKSDADDALGTRVESAIAADKARPKDPSPIAKPKAPDLSKPKGEQVVEEEVKTSPEPSTEVSEGTSEDVGTASVTIEEELASVAIEPKSKYTVGTKEAMKRLLQSKKPLFDRVVAQNIDLKDC